MMFRPTIYDSEGVLASVYHEDQGFYTDRTPLRCCGYSVLVGCLLPVVVKARQWCKEWAYGAFVVQREPVEAFLDDSTPESKLLKWTTNKPVRWTFVDMNDIKR